MEAQKKLKPKTEEHKMSLNIEAIIADIKVATVLELNDLVKAIEEEFGVTAAAPVAAAGAVAPAEEALPVPAI